MQRRWKLSSAQRADMWNRWKAGQSLNAIGRALGKDKRRVTEGSFRESVAVRGGYSPWPNGKTSPVGWPVAARCGSSLNV